MRISLCSGLAALGIAVVSTGCAGYRLGSMLPPDIKTVFVPTFVNNTTEPLLEVDTTRATIQEIQRDGSLRIANEQDADAILKVTLYDFSLSPVAYTKERRTQANEYRMTIRASLTLTRRMEDKVVVESPRVEGETVFDVTGDLTSSKAAALPNAAEDLAHKIVQRVVETW